MFGWMKRLFRNETSGTYNPKQWLMDWIWGGHRSNSGIPISAANALTYSSVFQAINMISGDVAKLPLYLNKALQTRGKERAKTHPAYYLTRRKPCPELTAYQFKKVMTANALLHGNSYAYIYRDTRYRPIEIVPLDSQRVTPVRVNGELWYVVTFETGEKRKMSPADVIHIRGLSRDGIVGLSFVEVAKESIGLGLAAEKYGAMFFQNGSMASGILEYPTRIDDDLAATIKRRWNDMHEGLDRSHRVAVLDKGVTFKQLTVTNEQAQFLQTRKFQRVDIASWFNISPAKLGDETKTSYASLEQDNLNHLNTCLEPWLVNFEEEFFDKLLTEAEKRSGDYDFEFLRAALLKPDTKARFDVYSIAIEKGIMSPNDVRDLENLNPYDGGDVYLIPLNMDVAGGDDAAAYRQKQEAVKAKPAAKKPKASKTALSAHRELVRSTVAKLIRWEVSAAQRAAKKPERFLQEVEDFYAKHEQTMTQALEPVLLCLSAVVRRPFDTEALVSQHVGSSRSALVELAGGVTAEQLPVAVDEAVGQWELRADAFVDLLRSKAKAAA